MANPGKYVPLKAAAPATPPQEAPGLTAGGVINALLGMGSRVGGSIGGAALGGLAAGPSIIGIPAGMIAGGAAGGALGEAVAERFFDPGDHSVNPYKVAVGGVMGAVPGSWAVRAGKPLASAALGAGLGYTSTAANKAAEGVPLSKAANPMSDEWSKLDVILGPVLGGGTGAAFGKFMKPKPAAPSPKPTFRVEGGKKVFTQPADFEPRKLISDDLVLTKNERSDVGKFETEQKQAARKRVSDTKKDISLSAQDTRPSTTSLSNIQEPYGPDLPQAPTIGSTLAIPETPSEATQAALSTPANKRILSTQVQQGRTKANQLANREDAAHLQDTRSRLGGTDLTQIQSRTNRDAANDILLQAQEAEAQERSVSKAIRDLNTQSKALSEIDPAPRAEKARQTLLKAREGADVEDARRTAQGIEQSMAEQQAGEIERLREGMPVEVEPTSMSETVSGPGEHGGKARATFRRTIEQSEGDEGGGGGSTILGPDGKPATPSAPKSLHWTAKDARDEADKFGGPEKWVVSRTKDGQFKLSPKGAELPPADLGFDPFDDNPPKGPAPKGPGGGVSRAITRAQASDLPFNQIAEHERKAIAVFLKEALETGKVSSETIEEVGNELADRVLQTRAGNGHARDAGALTGQLASDLRKAKVVIFDDGSEEIKRVRGALGKEASKIFSKVAGKPLDQVVTDIVRENPGRYSLEENMLGVNVTDAFLSRLEKDAVAGRTSTKDVDEVLDNYRRLLGRSVPDVEIGDYTGVQAPNEVPPVPSGGKGAKIADSQKGSDSLDVLLDAIHGETDGPPRINPEGHGTLSAEPEMGVDEFAATLSKEGEKPIAELPFTLSGGKGSQGAQPTQQELIDNLNTASKNYGRMKKRQASGEVVNEQERAASGQTAQAANKAVVEASPDSSLLTQLEEPAKGKVLSDLVKKTKGKGKGTTLSAFGAGQGSDVLRIAKENPMTAFRIAGGVGGAVTGAAVDDENPARGAVLGGAAGAAAPGALRATINALRSNPGAAKNEMEAVAGQVDSKLRTLGQMIPEWQRFSLLADTFNLPVNMYVGPWGSAAMGSLENAILNKFDSNSPGVKALKKLANIPGFIKSAERARTGEAKDAIKLASERLEGKMGKVGPPAFRKLTAIPGEAMVGGDISARNILMEAGFSEEEARRITLTSDPSTAFGKSVANFKKTKSEGGKGSPIRDLMLPFYRTSVNQWEQSLERTPGLGFLAQRAKDVPDEMKVQLAKQGIGGTIGAGAFWLGANAPLSDDPRDPRQKMFRKFINDLGGQYGTIVTMAFMAGQAYRNKGAGAIPGAIKTRISQGDLPLPTPQPILDILGSASQATGNAPFRLPSGILPGVIDPTNPKSGPSLARFALRDKPKEGSRPVTTGSTRPTGTRVRPKYTPIKPKKAE
jgi:hypothetical protein